MLITNVDDHLHNHGFLHVGHGQWRLAPAFDLNPFPDKERELKTWLTEATGPTGSVDEAMAAAPRFHLSLAEGRSILGEVERAVAQWRDVAKSIGVEMTARELARFRAGVRARGARAGAALGEGDVRGRLGRRRRVWTG